MGPFQVRFGSVSGPGVSGPFRVRFGLLGGVGVGSGRGASVREKTITRFMLVLTKQFSNEYVSFGTKVAPRVQGPASQMYGTHDSRASNTKRWCIFPAQ